MSEPSGDTSRDIRRIDDMTFEMTYNPESDVRTLTRTDPAHEGNPSFVANFDAEGRLIQAMQFNVKRDPVSDAFDMPVRLAPSATPGTEAGPELERRVQDATRQSWATGAAVSNALDEMGMPPKPQI